MQKIAKILCIIMVVALCFGTIAYANANIIGDLETKANQSQKDASGISTIGGKVIGALQVVATVVAIAVLLFVGIKFLLASPSEKAQLKGMLVPYLVGAVIIFAAIPILGMIKNMANGIGGTSGSGNNSGGNGGGGSGVNEPAGF